MCEQHHILSTLYDSIPMEFVSGFIHSLTHSLIHSRSWFRVNDILFITAMDIWASCETHNSSFFYFCAIFPLEAPSVPTADPSQAWNKNKHWIKWGAKVLELQRKEECCVLYCLNLGWLVRCIFLTFVSATFLQFLCIHGYGLDVCSCVYVYMSMFSLSLCFQWLYPREDTFHHHFFPTVGFHLNLRQKNIQYIIWYRTSESIRSRTCSRISNWMCVCQRNPHDKWLECVYSFRHDDVFLQPSSWKPLFISLTVVVDVDVVGIIFQWGFFSYFIRMCKHRERKSSSPSSIGWRNERKSTTIILEILSHAKVKGLKFIHWWCSEWQTAPLEL